ncbi:MAG TPA: murein biosynthesis integral membrane protein MurJ [Phycisphaerae bacterium]|nr:murein biosynthesis integral membrane protein MurJ [Phycisphaerae bacterium]
MSESTDRDRHEQEHFFSAAKVVAALTVCSRVLGMLRDIAIASLGANRTTSAFWLAFTIPNLFRRLFGEGALSAAFVPVFSETAESEGLGKARKLFANALALLAVTTAAIIVAVWAGLAIWALLGHWRVITPLWPDQQLLIRLLAIMLPFTVTTCLLALGAAALNCRGRFAYPAFAPMLLNLCLISAAWWIGPTYRGQTETQLTFIAAAVTVAGVLQLAGVLWVLKAAGFSIRPRLRPVQPGIRRMLKLMAPMLLGLGFLQFSELLNNLIAWLFEASEVRTSISLFGLEFKPPLVEGTLARINAARRLYQFPMGVLAISLGVAVFPLLSRYAARGDMPRLRESVNRAVRLSMMEGLAAGVGLFVLAGPITRLIFAHGKFTDSDAVKAAFTLRMYVLGLWAYCTYQIFARAFYALKDTRTPLVTSCVLVVPNMAMVAGLIWVPALREAAFGVATAATFAVNTALLAILLRRRIGRFGGRKLAVSVARSLIACAAMAGAIYLLRSLLRGRSDLVLVAVCVPAGAVVFLAAARLLRAPELGELLRRPGKANAIEDEVRSHRDV